MNDVRNTASVAPVGGAAGGTSSLNPLAHSSLMGDVGACAQQQAGDGVIVTRQAARFDDVDIEEADL